MKNGDEMEIVRIIKNRKRKVDEMEIVRSIKNRKRKVEETKSNENKFI